ncbi:MAG: AEC family transporter [Acidobacteria bacterium]|nr:AEC family transporter [Acidobacteriota bacterium]
MSVLANTLLPLILLIGLGATLSRIRFLGQQFAADLNKLAFWIALPALLFRSAAGASEATAATWWLLGVMLLGTLGVSLLGWAWSRFLGIPVAGQGTFVQSAFRGNLAFIGIPVLAASVVDAPESIRVPVLASGVIVMALTMAFYNVLAVIVLQASRPGGGAGAVALVRPIATNPLLLAGLSGLGLALAGVRLPAFVDRTLEVLGGAAVPIALLCIGGSLTTTRFVGRRSWIVSAALFKVAVSPLVIGSLVWLAGLGRMEMRIALVFASTSTAAAAYVMARQMEGDESLASGSIALSTVLSAISLAVALLVTPL